MFSQSTNYVSEQWFISTDLPHSTHSHCQYFFDFAVQFCNILKAELHRKARRNTTRSLQNGQRSRRETEGLEGEGATRRVIHKSQQQRRTKHSASRVRLNWSMSRSRAIKSKHNRSSIKSLLQSKRLNTASRTLANRSSMKSDVSLHHQKSS